MKKHILIIACYLITNHIFAQGQLRDAYHKNELGLSFLTMYSTFDSEVPEGNKLCGEPVMGYGLNFLYTANVSRYISLQTGAIYHSTFNNIQTADRSQYSIHLDNINVPFLFKLNMDKCSRINYSLFAGPQFNFNLASSYDVIKRPPNTTTNTRGIIKPVLSVSAIELSAAFGVNADLAVNDFLKFNIGYYGSCGFTDLSGPVAKNEFNILSEKTTKKTFGGYAGFSFTF